MISFRSIPVSFDSLGSVDFRRSLPWPPASAAPCVRGQDSFGSVQGKPCCHPRAPAPVSQFCAAHEACWFSPTHLAAAPLICLRLKAPRFDLHGLLPRSGNRDALPETTCQAAFYALGLAGHGSSGAKASGLGDRIRWLQLLLSVLREGWPRLPWHVPARQQLGTAKPWKLTACFSTAD
jgi:hypothetical protein